MKRKERKKKTGWIWAIVLAILLTATVYWVAVYFFVSAALVPSFMRKLDSFQRITEKSYEEQSHTSDIAENRKQSLKAAKEWIAQCPPVRKELLSEDGYRLVASEFLREEDDHKWVILLHGYTGWKEEMYPFAVEFYKRGYHCLVPDLRCQGESEGDFIGMGATDSRDVRGWIDMILQEDPQAEIILFGQSMGAATALILSGDPDLPDSVKAVISDSSYTDAYTMFGDKARDWFSLPPFPIVNSMRDMLLLRGGYDLYDASPVRAVSHAGIPILFLHGREDRMISVDQAYRLMDAASSGKELLIIDGAGHGQPQDKDPKAYYGAIFHFLEKA